MYASQNFMDKYVFGNSYPPRILCIFRNSFCKKCLWEFLPSQNFMYFSKFVLLKMVVGIPTLPEFRFFCRIVLRILFSPLPEFAIFNVDFQKILLVFVHRYDREFSVLKTTQSPSISFKPFSKNAVFPLPESFRKFS